MLPQLQQVKHRFEITLRTMLSLPRSGRFRRLGGTSGFRAASTLWQLQRETKLRNQKLWKNKRLKSNYRQNQQRFQIYNKVSKTWANQIDESPILLTVNDIKNWHTFRTDKLQQHRLYLWHATQFDWIPIWTTKNGCLLMNLNILKYDDVNYHQFTKANWIKQNSVDPESIKELLQKFNISGESIKTMVPVINSAIQNGRMAASGQPYFINFLDKSNEQIPFYDIHRHTWSANRFFDRRDIRYNYQFIKEYQKTWYYNVNPQHNNQVTQFGDAINQSGNGTYMYVEKNCYIPYRIHNGMITFNRGDPVEIKTIRPGLNQNRVINTNTYNKLVRKDYEQLAPSRQSLFIEPVSNMYRREFMINYKRTIPQYFWEGASFDSLFDNHNELSTFMLLDNSCEYGAPVGIIKQTKSILLNNNQSCTWSEFKEYMFNNDIIKYQNLDFKGNNY